MTSKKIQEEKIQKYRQLLSRPYWELREGIAFLCGCIDFGLSYNLESEISKAYGISDFSMRPLNCNDKKFCGEFNSLLKLIFNAAKIDQIDAKAIKLFKIEYSDPPENYTYLLKPYELIAFTVTQGIIIPSELQAALNLHQIEIKRSSLTKPLKKKVMRDAVAHALWYKHPEASISEINRKYYSLRNYREYDFINDSKNRSRTVVAKFKPLSTNVLPTVPGTIEQRKGLPAFNFQKISIVLKTLVNLISLAKPHLIYEEILQHPLINCYQPLENQALAVIIDFCLKDLRKEMYLRNAKQESRI